VLLKPGSLLISYKKEFCPLAEEWDVHYIVKSEFTAENTVVLKYGEFPFRTIEVNDPNFLKALNEKYPDAPFQRASKSFYSGFSAKKIIAIGALFIALLTAVYFYALPWFADAFANRLPFETEQALVLQIHEKFISQFPVDTAKTLALSAFFKALGYNAPHPVTVSVLKSKELNAFAIPGGYIYVFDSLLHILDNPEQLAALLAHEYAHVKLKHSSRALIRNLSGFVFLSILLGDVSGVTAVILQNAESLRSLQYTRGLEEEADRHGMEMMIQSGINPEGMTQLLEKLKKYGHDAPLEIISSHPLMEHRIENLKKEIVKINLPVEKDEELYRIWAELNNH